MKIFITGGTGFIGKYVVNRLITQGHTVQLLSRSSIKSPNKQIKLVKGDLSNIDEWKNKLKSFQPEVCIHLAWEGLPDHSLKLSELNLKYGLDLLKILSEIKCPRVLIIGSCFEYGVQKGKISEKTLPKPFDAFTAAKHSLRWLGGEIAKQNNMDFIWIRPFFVYGPGQHHKSLIPYILNSVKSGLSPEIRNLKAKNDFIYVEDLADAISKIMKKGKNGETYNVGSGKLTSIKQILNYIYKDLQIKNNYKQGEKIYKDVMNSFYADITKIQQETNWIPKTDIKVGIKKTVSFYNTIA